MKRSFLVLVFLALALPGLLSAQQDDFGVGIVLGEPTGLSLKKWLGGRSAVDAALAWSFTDGGAFHVHVDYLRHDFTLIQVREGSLPFYYGIGGRLKHDNNAPDPTTVSARAPVGLSYMFQNHPIDIFFEVALLLDITPESKLAVNSGVGFRYYFR